MMVVSLRKGGFGAVEVLVIVLALIFVVILVNRAFFGRSIESKKRTPCLNNLRQLAVQAQMYAQDHGGNFPGVNWLEDMNYHGTLDLQLLRCDEDRRSKHKRPVSYGYSGLLLHADGSGVNLTQIPTPEEVGILFDASPTKTYPDGGIVAGGGLQPPAKVVTLDARHHGASCVAYVDGHVAASRLRKSSRQYLDNEITRALYLANALGYVDNPVGGMSDFTPRVLGTGPVAIGGDPCTASLLRAAAAAWRQKARVNIINCGFDGQYSAGKRPPAYVWGIGDGMKPVGNAVAIGRDAVAVIIHNHSTLAPRGKFADGPVMTYDTMRRFFNGTGTAHIYTYDRNSGTRAFLTRMLGTNGKPMPISNTAVIVKDDWEMVKKIAQDRDGIGYCSAAVVDVASQQFMPVFIVGLQFADGHVTHYPQAAPYDQRYETLRWIVPTNPSWPLMRTLYAVSTLPKDNHFVDEMLTPGSPGVRALQAGPLFKASYYRPVVAP